MNMHIKNCILLTLKAPPIICSRRQFQICCFFKNNKKGMIYYENRLLADDSHEISYLIFSEFGKDVSKVVVCRSRDWRFKG